MAKRVSIQGDFGMEEDPVRIAVDLSGRAYVPPSAASTSGAILGPDVVRPVEATE